MRRSMALLVVVVCIAMPCFAQTRTLTTDDYARAEKFMGYNTNPLVLHSGVRPTWLQHDRFWYRVATENGNECVLVDPARHARTAPLDHARVAAALSSASGAKYAAFRLPFTTFNFAD